MTTFIENIVEYVFVHLWYE